MILTLCGPSMRRSGTRAVSFPTAAKQEMIDLARPGPLRWCKEQLREGGLFEDREIMTVQELVQAAERSRANASRDVNATWAADALTAEGFTRVKQARREGPQAVLGAQFAPGAVAPR
jgi:hypothetical protein